MKDDSLKLSPIPSSGLFIIENMQEEKVEMSILSMLGKGIFNYTGNDSKIHVDLSREKEGTYLLKMLLIDKRIYSTKLIIVN